MLRRLSLALAIATGLALVVAWEMSYFGAVYVDICEKNQYTGHENCAPNNVALVALWKIGEALNYYGIAITALATVVIGCFTVTLAGVGRRQIADTRVLERAYVSVEPGGLRAFRSPDDGYIACDVIFNNAGNLPARNVAWLIERRFDTDKHAKEFPIESELAGDIVIAPKGRVRKGSPPIETSEFMRRKDEGKFDQTWVYVWGRVTYHDGFVAGRHTNFCHRYNLRGEEWFGIPEENARYHEHGNSTDD